MAKTTKAKGPWKDPEVCQYPSIDWCLNSRQAMGGTACGRDQGRQLPHGG